MWPSLSLITACVALTSPFGARLAPTPRAALLTAKAPTAPDIGGVEDLAALIEEWRREDDRQRLLDEAAAAERLAAETMDDSAAAPHVPPAPSTRLDRARARLRRSLDEEDSGLAMPHVPYDPDVAAARFASQPMAVGLRQMRLLGPLLGFITKVVVDVRQGTEEAHRDARAKELTELIGALGPAIIKAGQALSSRADLLPSAYLRELATLQDRVPPFAHADALARIEAELGKPLPELFARVGSEPVAAASLGQVCTTRGHPPTHTLLPTTVSHLTTTRGCAPFLTYLL